MARKDPYAPEEGIIDLFDIVDNPEASPEPEPRGALYDDGAQALPEQPEASEPENPSREEAERVVSRYPFENNDDLLESIEKAPLMTLLPPKEETSEPEEIPVSGYAEGEASAGAPPEPAPEEPDEALIRAFEAEMAKAGAVVHEYGVGTSGGSETQPEAETSVAAEPEYAGTPSEAQETSGMQAAERTYAEDLELLFGDAGSDAPQPEPLPCEAEASVMEAPAHGSSEEETAEIESGSFQQPADTPEETATEPSESLPSFVSVEESPLPELSVGGVEHALAFVPVAPEAPANAVEPQAEPSRCSHEMEERIIRLEETLSRLNERVVALEQRADDADERELAVSALSGDIQSLLTEGNVLCGQLKSLASAFDSKAQDAPAEMPAAETSAFVAEEPAHPSTPSASADIPWESSVPEADSDDGPDVLGLALESLERRLALLESRPVQASDAAGIAQDVLALVRVDMEKASEEHEASARVLEQLERRVQDLENRPLPQLILPELPDTEAITADIMGRIQGELDRIAAEAAARVLREEIAGLMRK